MTKLEKLNNELKRTKSEIEKGKAKEIELKNKIMFEEEKEVRKMMDTYKLNITDLQLLIKKEMDSKDSL
ncbi:MAG: hypothetical protein RR788_04100 [Erysipelotrichaceae bacterium]